MATTATLIKATQFSAVYKISGDNILGLIDYTDAPTLAGLVEGPLKVEIRRRLANATLPDLNLSVNSQRVRIYEVTGIDDDIAVAVTKNIYWVANGIAIVAFVGFEAPNAEVYFEVRFEHSEKR